VLSARSQRYLPLALFLFAFLFRAYRLAANPLWLDEIGGLQLARLGLRAILANSSLDPHPPGYYLWLWLTTFGGAWASELAMRWSSVLFGALAVPVVYALARRYANIIPAALAALMILISPVHLYFSQEARSPALLFLLAALTAWLLESRSLSPRLRWLVLAALTLLGCYVGYSYLSVALVQGFWVWWTERESRAARRTLIAIGVGLAPLLLVAVRTLSSMVAEGASQPLLLRDLFAALLAGDTARYGSYWGHFWLPLVFGVLALAAAWRLSRHPSPLALYYPLQVLAPVAGYFLVVGPLLSIAMPIFQSRQFIPLLPALYVLAAAGLDHLWAAARGQVSRPLRPLAAVSGVTLSALAVFASLAGVGRYWAESKSPEGQMARYVRDHLRPDVTVISLHYSLDGAFSAYPIENRLYTKPLGPPPETMFSDSLSITRAGWTTLTRPYTVGDVAQSSSRWVLWLAGENEDWAAALTAGCGVIDEAAFGPFRAAEVEGCPVTAATPTAP
jgi:uncharacterized membrane protein